MRPCIVAVALLIGGCAGCGIPTVENQARATYVVWRDAYRMGTNAAPIILWRTQKDLTCSCGSGMCLGWEAETWTDLGAKRQCVGGLFRRERWLAEVALPFGYELADVAFAHELLHAAIWSRCEHSDAPTCDGDPGHYGPEWKPGGDLEWATAMLREL